MKHKLILIASVLFFMLGAARNSTGQWVQTNCPIINPVTCFAEIGTNLFAGTIGDFNNQGGYGVFRSTDNGTTWSAASTGLVDKKGELLYVFSLAVSGSNLYAGTYRAGVFLTTDSGANWTAISTGLSRSPVVNALAVSGANLFAGTDSGVFLSTDNGTSWRGVHNGLSRSTFVQSLVGDGMNLFAGTTDSGIYLTTNNGETWSNIGFPMSKGDVQALAVSGTNLFAVNFANYYGSIFLTTNSGANWTEVDTGLTHRAIGALVVNGTNLFAGSVGGGVFLSTNNGTSWAGVNTGLANDTVWGLAMSGANLFAGTRSGGVWRRPLSEFGSSGVPLSAHSQRTTIYPNPVNEETTISYTITTAGIVSIEVFDALSKSVAVLVHQTMQPGNYETTFDAHARLEGVYYYRLDTGGVVETKKLVVVR